ncbi:DUF1800 domain-containing protein [Orrella sp. JC864]|uniref:DUF1800 domain-containing protein n=1 Tax=Orrella sp. JC864 TaxID=3120298 RepID=UPI00300AAF97
MNPARRLFTLALASAWTAKLPVAWATQANDASSLKSDLSLLNRISWGISKDDFQRLRAEGRDAFLARQLKPDLRVSLPEASRRHLASLELINRPAEQRLAGYLEREARMQKMPRGEKRMAEGRRLRQEVLRAADQSAQRAVIYAIHSPNQLNEAMTWFWLNHFSVYRSVRLTGLLVPELEAAAIRPRALGRFQDLLTAVVYSPAMLSYLDNVRNYRGSSNENYARELMELHTLGVDGGYTQKDVQELARVLTGFTIDDPVSRKAAERNPGSRPPVKNGVQVFYPSLHDDAPKKLLGKEIRQAGPEGLTEALDILCGHPATATFISRKMATYFLPTTPSDSLTDKLARRFAQSGGDIAQVLGALFDSEEFQLSLAQGKFKDPVHYVLSAVRLRMHAAPAIQDAEPILRVLVQANQGYYGRPTPDGYPLMQAEWSGSGQMAARLQLARSLAMDGPQGIYGDTLEGKQQPISLNDAFFKDSLHVLFGSKTLDVLKGAKTAREWNTYLLASPEFMYR